LIEVTSQNPARIFDLRKGALVPGYDADFIIVGDAKEIRKEKMHSKAGWTPFNGMKGIFPRMTISRGEVVFEEGEITGKRGRGMFIPGRGFKTGHEEDTD
jgi:dihydroorotase